MPRHFLITYRKLEKGREVVAGYMPRQAPTDVITLQTGVVKLHLHSQESDFHPTFISSSASQVSKQLS